MKLLIVTQKIDKNDDILGFFCNWVNGLSKNTEEVFVIAQFVGEYDLPENVKVFSLGKESGFSKTRQLFNFYKLLFRNLPKIDAVFVHMIPLWVVLGSPFFKIYRKKVYLWYTHKSVNLTLKIAEKIVTKIFTASEKSFRLKSKKIIVTGHGIDVDRFKIYDSRFKNKGFRIITVGRISPVKNLHLLVEAGEILRDKGFSAGGGPASGWGMRIAGAPVFEQDKIYFEKLKKLVKEKRLDNEVNFAGRIPYRKIPEFYAEADLFVNLSDTGSIDKVVLEAMASGLPVLTSNEAFQDILPKQCLANKNPREIAGKIMVLSKGKPGSALREYVIKNHSLKFLIPKIINVIKQN